ncbi:LysR family transcriptional regulator [Nocardioides sp. KIGAM211]|uniref:LysR family transcriptional regulator n=1 Tax=Nocardioides luti TaxID=2761101 RepID=A0A7X0RJF9_9ACTN|nr:LysR family transcriptional regulator [Nocardioides luti]MBB6629275.1 LysR family transcriptional regulator [Nocardioides luti]
MELRQLEYVVVLSEELNFRRAADRLSVAQSALSQQVQRLERELGVRLFSRSTHHVRLTPAGDAFLREARQVLAAVARARTAARVGATGELTLCIGDGAIDTMPVIAEEIRRRHPSVVVHEVDGSPLEQRRMFAEGRLDLGFGHPHDQAPLGRDLEATLLRLEPVGVFVPASHPYADRASLRPADLAGQPLLFPPRDRFPEYHAFLVQILGANGVRADPYTGSAQSLGNAMNVVARGDAVLCGPELTNLRPSVVWRPLHPVPAWRTSLVRLRRAANPMALTAWQVALDVARERGWLAEPVIAPGDQPIVD